MDAPETTPETDTAFTLDPALLAQRKAENARRVHTVQIPAIRAAGFVILCAIAALHDLRGADAFPRTELLALVALNALYAGLSWIALRRAYGRTRFDLSLLLFHVDVLVWLPNLHHLEQSNLFFAYLLLVRVADQVGFGFRRAFYFNHVVVFAYLGYATWMATHDPARAPWTDRLPIAAVMYLIGTYLAFTGSVIGRLRKRTRLAMRAARDLVENLGQKTRSLQAQAIELEQARRDAEQAARAKSQFLAVMSHELRTPLNGVLGTTELLLGTALAPAQRELAKTAYRSGLALLALIDDVLDLSRIQAGKLALRETRVELRALCAEAVEMLAQTARDKGLALDCDVAPRLPACVMADAARLRQVLVNLLHNAVKFTERGAVHVEMSVVDETHDAVRVRCTVRDTGIGIAPEQRERVFDTFMQVDASSTRRFGGSGLGLAIVRQLVELMDGRVGVDSRLGEGSTFWFELPLKKALAEQVAAEAPAPWARVLLAEDDPINQMVIINMLTSLGSVVDTVADGRAACEAAAEGRYDLILMDLHMPVMDGHEATRRIRTDEQPQGRYTPIVAVTADALATDRDRCIESGMDDYLTKPISSAALAAILERWAGRRTAPLTQW